VELRPPEPVVPSITIVHPVPPVPPITAHASGYLLAAVHPNNTEAKAAGETSQAATGNQAAHVADLARDDSLWDRAYDALKDEEPDLIAAYEDLLSGVPIGGELRNIMNGLLSMLTEGEQPRRIHDQPRARKTTIAMSQIESLRPMWLRADKS
jgi:hypothetical protein